MDNVDKEVTYCAVNAFGWAYDNTLVGALSKLGGSYDNKKYYTPEREKKTLLRVYVFKSNDLPTSWAWYCPQWKSGEKHRFWIISDSMGGINYHLPILIEYKDGSTSVVEHE